MLQRDNSVSHYVVYFETDTLPYPNNYPKTKISKIIKHEKYTADESKPDFYIYDFALLKLVYALFVSISGLFLFKNL